MTENSYLDPVALLEQSKSATYHLEKDNEAFAAAEAGLYAFHYDTELEGEAFNSLKQHVIDYTTVLRALRSANDSDIADFKRLTKKAGLVTLDGAKILQGKKNAYDEMCRYSDLRDEYANKAENCNAWECVCGIYLYYLNKAGKYANLSNKQVEIYNEYRDKENKYDDIQSETSSLFTASSSLRSYARKALEEITKAFVDGQYVLNMDATWRTNLYMSYYNRIFKDNGDGTFNIAMEEVEKILDKDAANITSEEYDMLALAFINADEDQLEDIICYMMGNKEEQDYTWYQELLAGHVDYSEWSVDEQKSTRIMYKMASLAEAYLGYIQGARAYESGDVAEGLVAERSVMLQRITLLNTINGIGKFRGKLDDKNPTIGISISEEQEITVTLLEWGLIGAKIDPVIYNLKESKVVIGPTKLGSEIDNTAAEDMKYRFSSYFGNVELAKDTGKFVVDETTGELIDAGTDMLKDYAVKKTGKEAFSRVIGCVPFVGDVASFGIDMAMSYSEADQQNDFMKSEFKKLDSALIYSDFDCCANFVKYDMTDNYNNDIFVYPGERTDEIIVELNDKLGTELNRYNVLYDTNEVNKQMGELQKDYRTRAKINDIFENKN